MIESLKLDEGDSRLLNSWITLLGARRLLLHVTVRRCRSFLVSVGCRCRWLWVKKSVERSRLLFNALSAVMFVWACARKIPFTSMVLPVVVCLTGTALISFFEHSPAMAIVWCWLHTFFLRIIKLINLFLFKRIKLFGLSLGTFIHYSIFLGLQNQ